MKLLRREEGFTLIELMVVVLIIGILVAIAIPVFQSTQQNARRRACFANQRTVEGAVQQFNAERNDFGGGVVTAAGQLTISTYTSVDAQGNTISYGPWIQTVPRCPAAPASATNYDNIDAAGKIAGGGALPCTHPHY